MEVGLGSEWLRSPSLFSDELTAAAVRRLQKHVLTMPKILRTPDAKVEELLYGVGFHRKKVCGPALGLRVPRARKPVGP